MFSKLSEYLTQQLENENIISADKRELYKYGFQNGLILILNFVTSVTIGVVFGKALESILLLVAYMPLRSYAGGHHSDSSKRCYVVSSCIMGIWVGMLRTGALSTSCCVIILTLGAAVCLCIAPVEDKNKPLDETERRVFRKRSIIILFLEILIWLFLSFVIKKYEQIIPIVIFTEGVMLILGNIKNTVAKIN